MHEAWDRIPYLSLRHQGRNCSLTISFMFNKLFNNTVVRHGHSDCAKYIIANVADGTAYVRYNNGRGYLYTNVSRRSLINLIVNDNISLGRWINDCLLFNGSKCAKFGTCENVYEYTLA